jgi:hypothetical protein
VFEAVPHGMPFYKLWRNNLTCDGQGGHHMQLQCSFSSEWADGAHYDAALYFVPHMCWGKQHLNMPQLPGGANLPKILFYTEPPQYTRCLFDQAVVSQFDILAGWRTCSSVFYQHLFPMHLWALALPTVQPAERHDAIAFIQSNCGAINEALNSRSERIWLVQEIMKMGQIEVHAHGSCMHNMQNRSVRIDHLPPYHGPPLPTNGDAHQKLSIFRHYKFCMAGENNRYPDYVTEKVGGTGLRLQISRQQCWSQGNPCVWCSNQGLCACTADKQAGRHAG